MHKRTFFYSQIFNLFSLIFFLLSFTPATAQIAANTFLQNESLRLSATLPETGVSFKYNLEDHLFKYSGKDSLIFGVDLSAEYQSGALIHYDNYEDNLHYLLSPYLHYALFPQLKFDVRVNVENIRDNYLYPQRIYWADEFRNHRGGFEVAKISYESKYISVKFGRDYFMPGQYFYEKLLFSAYNYPYDQLNITFHNDYFQLSSYYLSLNTMTYDGNTHLRHLNGHRLSVNLKHGHIALNDIMLYGGENAPIDLMMFNPFILFYPYRKNKKHLSANNIMSLEFYWNYHDYFIFTELLLDDYQADKEIPEDLEPPEWGMNVTLGKNDLMRNVHWKINYTHVANRTFNAPDFDYEKFIYKNYPVGHWLGNNFWEIKTSLTYKTESLIADLTYYHYEAGEEALYAEFNKDYLDYTVEQGYCESFPFGPLRRQSGLVLNTFYEFRENILFNAKLGYWFVHDITPDALNFKIGAAYHY